MMSITDEEWATYTAMLFYLLIGSLMSFTVSPWFGVSFVGGWVMLTMAIRFAFFRGAEGTA